jgi:hypothetical protein
LVSWTSAALTPWQACHTSVHSAHWTGERELQGELGVYFFDARKCRVLFPVYLYTIVLRVDF